MPRATTIELFKEDMKFSAGHFTVFSATERERLHGHNFNVYVALRSEIDDNGLVLDYGVYKKKLYELCRNWNERFLLAADSPFLTFEREGDMVRVRFGAEVIPFLVSDVLMLPVTNVTVEELAALMLKQVVAFRAEQGHNQIFEIVVKVFSGPGQSGSADWSSRV